MTIFTLIHAWRLLLLLNLLWTYDHILPWIGKDVVLKIGCRGGVATRLARNLQESRCRNDEALWLTAGQ